MKPWISKAFIDDYSWPLVVRCSMKPIPFSRHSRLRRPCTRQMSSGRLGMSLLRILVRLHPLVLQDPPTAHTAATKLQAESLGGACEDLKTTHSRMCAQVVSQALGKH